jgi:hypothetical protein
MTHSVPDPDELLDALAAGVLPEQLPDWDRATSSLPVFDLCRSLFSTSPADTVLKLVVLLALSKSEGRFSRERTRTLVPHLDSGKLDLLITSLYKGGWLQLRASDNTYRLPPQAFFLLNLLIAADFAGQTPANMLVRAVETVAFGDRIDQETTGHLLSVLLAELQTQAEQARRILAEGTPRQLIRFSRQEVRDQILHVGQVISAIEERTDASSDHFARLVHIHEALQEILRSHEGLGRRLAEWNLKRLETSDAGYSLVALGDAVLGSTDDELLEFLPSGILSVPAPAVCLVTRRLLTRHRTTRPSMARERASFEYQPPTDSNIDEVTLDDVDPLQRVRQRVLAAIESGQSITAALLEDAKDFHDAVFQLNLLARIEGREPADDIELTEGVRIQLHTPAVDPVQLLGLSTEQALEHLVQSRILVDIKTLGLHPQLEVTQ